MLEIKLNGYKKDAAPYFQNELESSKNDLISAISSNKFTDMPFHEKWEFITKHKYTNLYILIYGIKSFNKELKVITDEYYRYKNLDGSYSKLKKQ